MAYVARNGLVLVRYGTDSSGRPILATPYAVVWLDELVRRCRAFRSPFTPTIVQGAFMALLGGGAAQSAGYHDGSGCYDFRVWNLTAEQLTFLIRETRRMGAASWHRDQAHGGMDEHAHLVINGDHPELQAPGARAQWGDYLAGRNGLASGGADYHWRPDPLVTGWKVVMFAPAKTPNISAALGAKTRAGRKAALRQVIAHGSPKAVAPAKALLASILTIEAAEQKARAAKRALAGQEVR